MRIGIIEELGILDTGGKQIPQSRCSNRESSGTSFRFHPTNVMRVTYTVEYTCIRKILLCLIAAQIHTRWRCIRSFILAITTKDTSRTGQIVHAAVFHAGTGSSFASAVLLSCDIITRFSLLWVVENSDK